MKSDFTMANGFTSFIGRLFKHVRSFSCFRRVNMFPWELYIPRPIMYIPRFQFHPNWPIFQCRLVFELKKHPKTKMTRFIVGERRCSLWITEPTVMICLYTLCCFKIKHHPMAGNTITTNDCIGLPTFHHLWWKGDVLYLLWTDVFLFQLHLHETETA